ncbi:MAG: Mov34/MPN/PAD family protein [Thermoleophilia bacterium]|nr:Mov34/MPN/PAD family protein [Thermoleophilia bacterium]
MVTEPLGRTTATRFDVSPELWEQLVTLARAEKPKECCGVGIGPVGEVARFHALENVHEEPITRYEISSKDQLRVHLEAEDNGWDVTLVFHSHPATEPYPSATDLALAGWPDAVYAIIGMADPDQPLLRAYRIVDAVITELDVRHP